MWTATVPEFTTYAEALLYIYSAKISAYLLCYGLKESSSYPPQVPFKRLFALVQGYKETRYYTSHLIERCEEPRRKPGCYPRSGVPLDFHNLRTISGRLPIRRHKQIYRA